MHFLSIFCVSFISTGIKANFDDVKEGIFGQDTLFQFIFKTFSPEKFGYEEVDALNYYTNKLKFYNDGESASIFCS